MFTVSAVAHRIKSALDDAATQPISVQGEVTDYDYVRGNAYYKLKDDYAVLPCYHNNPDTLLEDGDRIIADGTLTIYEERGVYQLTVTNTDLRGEGAFKKQFRQAKQALKDDGYLSQPSQTLPTYPSTIGIITSKDSSAIHDVTGTIQQRYPYPNLFLAPTSVQGNNAPKDIGSALKRLSDIDVDLIILTRGGGSTDDLLCFNDISLAKQIARANTPIISGIGHDDDTTIADLVADYKTATPTQAAMKATPSVSRQRRAITQHQQEAQAAIKQRVYDEKQRVKTIQQDATKHIRQTIQEITKRIATLKYEAQQHYPQHILDQHYYPIYRDNDRITVKDIAKGETIRIEGYETEVEATVQWTSKKN